MRRLNVLLTTTLLIAGFAGTGSTPTAAEPDMTGRFVPSSTSWTSTSHGWVLGFESCFRGRCPVLLRTFDAGATWWPAHTAQVQLPANNRRVRVHFANDWDGLITDGTRLYATHTAGFLWRQVSLPGTGDTVSIGRLASNDRALFAIVGGNSSTRLYSSPLWFSRWQPVPGVALAYQGGGDIVAHGQSAYVALNAVFRAHGYWTTSESRVWHQSAPPCSVQADPDLGLVSGTVVYALCSYNPGMGYMFKDLMTSAPGGPFTLVSHAPTVGITRGFAAASKDAVAATAIGTGAAYVHRGIDGGTSWQTPLMIRGLPMNDLAFTDARHGVLVWGGPRSASAAVYRTTDSGATWTPITITDPLQR